MKTSIRARWRNAYRAARMGHEVALHFKRRDCYRRCGIIVRPGGPSAWGHMGGGSIGADYGRWLAERPFLTPHYRAWYLSTHGTSIPHPHLPR